VTANPPAGELRKKDLKGLWLQRALQLQAVDSRKAVVAIQLKREINLAKQTVAGLKNLGLQYDVTELSIILRRGFQVRGKGRAEGEHGGAGCN
jgi:hypothetical protein